jgi:hypothetical protein
MGGIDVRTAAACSIFGAAGKGGDSSITDAANGLAFALLSRLVL